MTKQKLIEEINALSVSGLDQLRFSVVVWNERRFDRAYECHDIDTVAGLLFDLSLSHAVFMVGCYGINTGGLHSVTLSLHSLSSYLDTNLDSESIDAILDFLKRQWRG